MGCQRFYAIIWKKIFNWLITFLKSEIIFLSCCLLLVHIVTVMRVMRVICRLNYSHHEGATSGLQGISNPDSMTFMAD